MFKDYTRGSHQALDESLNEQSPVIRSPEKKKKMAVEQQSRADRHKWTFEVMILTDSFKCLKKNKIHSWVVLFVCGFFSPFHFQEVGHISGLCELASC